MRKREAVILVAIAVLFTHVRIGVASPITFSAATGGDKAFIDNRQANDPFLQGLNLNLGVVGNDALATPIISAKVTPSNAFFPFSPIPYPLAADVGNPFNLGNGQGAFSFGATFVVTPAQLSSLSGTYAYNLTDANGSATDTSHNLDRLEVLQFPTVPTFSNHSTTL